MWDLHITFNVNKYGRNYSENDNLQHADFVCTGSGSAFGTRQFTQTQNQIFISLLYSWFLW